MSDIEIIFKFINLKKILNDRYGLDVYCDRKCIYVNDNDTKKSISCASIEAMQGIVTGISLLEGVEEDVAGV